MTTNMNDIKNSSGNVFFNYDLIMSRIWYLKLIYLQLILHLQNNHSLIYDNLEISKQSLRKHNTYLQHYAYIIFLKCGLQTILKLFH